MRLSSLLTCFLLYVHLCTSCSPQDGRRPALPKAAQKFVDTTDVAVIAFDRYHDWAFDHTYISTTVSNAEIQLIDNLLKQCVSSYNQKLDPKLKSCCGIDFEKYEYKTQYMAALNKKGEKEVWVNGFCDTWDKQWRTEIIHVKDGGNCFFNFKINLATKQCFEVSVNDSP